LGIINNRANFILRKPEKPLSIFNFTLN